MMLLIPIIPANNVPKPINPTIKVITKRNMKESFKPSALLLTDTAFSSSGETFLRAFKSFLSLSLYLMASSGLIFSS